MKVIVTSPAGIESTIENVSEVKDLAAGRRFVYYIHKCDKCTATTAMTYQIPNGYKLRILDSQTQVDTAVSDALCYSKGNIDYL